MLLIQAQIEVAEKKKEAIHIQEKVFQEQDLNLTKEEDEEEEQNQKKDKIIN